MSERRVVTCPSSGTGGRGVGLADRMPGAACRVHDLDRTVFRQHGGLTGRDELDVAASGRIEWHAGEPEVGSR